MFDTILFIFWWLFWALSTFLLQKYISVVLASCIIWIIWVLLEELLKITSLSNYLSISPHLSLVIFAWTFVWMSNYAVWTIPIIILAWLLSGLIYKISLNIFAWFWGRLWTIAFLSTILIVYCFKYINILKYKFIKK